MAKYFSDVVVDPYVRHYDDKDGFQVRLQFRHILEDEVEIKTAKVRLVCANASQGKDIWLESTEPMRLRKGLNRVWLGCNVSISRMSLRNVLTRQINTIGPYMVDKIMLEAKRIVFVHEPFAKTEASTPLGIITSVSAHSLKAAKKARILCFPRTEAFNARIYLSHFIHIDKPRHVEVECSSGWNDIARAEIHLKSASAGLRLRTASASVMSGDVAITDVTKPGLIATGPLPANSSSSVSDQTPF